MALLDRLKEPGSPARIETPQPQAPSVDKSGGLQAPKPEAEGWQRAEELLSKAPELRPAVKETEAPSIGWQARGRTKPMGIRPGVTDAAGRVYKDGEAELTFTKLGPDQRFLASSGNRSMVCVFGSGSGTIDGKEVRAGQVVTLQPGQEQTLRAGKDGLEVFVARLNSGLGDGVPPAQVLPRLPLGTFEAEQIIVAPGTPYAFDGKFNVAEVIVPPGVRTSEHLLSINERYLMLEGAGTMFLDGREIPVSKGSVVHIPAGTAQAIRNDSGGPMRFYCLCSPPFTADAFTPGAHHGAAPDGFELADWWARNSSAYA